METKANYVAVGAFVFACMIAFFIALLWLAGSQYNEEFTHYQTYFTGSVTGLGKGTSVRFNGIEVGHISTLDFDPNDPKRVIVTMEVDPELKLHQGAVASIAQQGLTGGAYVEIEGGEKDSPLLVRGPNQEYPIIPSKPSTLQLLADSAPKVVDKLDHIADRLAILLSDKNLNADSSTLEHIDNTTAVFDKRRQDLNDIIVNLKNVSQSLNGDMDKFNSALVSTDRAMRGVDRFVNGDTLSQLSRLVSETRGLVSSLNRLSNDLDRQPTKLLFGDRRQGYTPQ